MKSMYECTSLETFKRNLNTESLKRVAAFYEPVSLKGFLSGSPAEVKEKIFSISNPTIFFEILNPLIELNRLYNPKQLPESPSTVYKLEQLQDKRIATATVQSLNLLSDIIEDPDLKNLLSEFIFLEKKIIASQTASNTSQPLLDSKNIIADPKKLFESYDKVLKVQEQAYLKVFDGYQKLLGNFAKGFKHVCKKENEENYFFQVANYFLHTFPHEITIEEVLMNRLYANILAFGYVLENRILRAFEKNKRLSKDKNEIVVSKASEASSKIHFGKLSFLIVESTFEMNEYEDVYGEQEAYNQMSYADFVDDLEELEYLTKGSDLITLTEKRELKVKCAPKISDTSSVLSASTSESSADSETLRAKRKHRRRSRKNKRKGAENQTPEEYLSNAHAWSFQNWVYGITSR